MQVADDFAGTGAVSGNWTLTRNSLSRVGGLLAGAQPSDYNNMRWSANTFANAQYSEIVIAASNAFYCNTSVRASGIFASVNWSHYMFVANPGTDARLERWVNDVQQESNLGNYRNFGARPIPANGDSVRLAIDSGYTITVYINGVLQWTYTDTDAPAALASGGIGCGCYNTDSRIESWLGGDDTSDSTTTIRRVNRAILPQSKKLITGNNRIVVNNGLANR